MTIDKNKIREGFAGEEEAMLRVQDAARILNTSPRTIQRFIDRGHFKAYKIGGIIRLPRKDFFQDLERFRKS